MLCHCPQPTTGQAAAPSPAGPRVSRRSAYAGVGAAPSAQPRRCASALGWVATHLDIAQQYAVSLRCKRTWLTTWRQKMCDKQLDAYLSGCKEVNRCLLVSHHCRCYALYQSRSVSDHCSALKADTACIARNIGPQLHAIPSFRFYVQAVCEEFAF